MASETSEITQAIVALARELSAEELSDSTVALTHGALFDAALKTFGTWDVALATALVETVQGGWRAKPATPAQPPPERVADPDALRPLYAITATGYVLSVSAQWFPSSQAGGTPRPPRNWYENLGRVWAVHDLDHPGGVAAWADDGRLFGWDARLVPDADAGEAARRLGATSGVVLWRDLSDRDRLYKRERLITVSALGKVKASDIELLPRPVTQDGAVACLIDEGDRLVAGLSLDGDESILLVSSNGYAIHFACEEVRPMGLRAAGVKGMGLRGPATVIGAVVPGRHRDVALISAHGYAKRVPLDEFRPQSRAGLGLVAAKLARRDQLVAAVGCDASRDLLIVTKRGACLRLPAHRFAEMGRPARGDQVVDLDDGDAVHSLACLPPMSFETE